MAVPEHGDQELERIVEAAGKLFVQLGYDGTTMQLIADVAGLSTESMHRLPTSKQELYLEVVKRFYQDLDTQMRALMDRVAPDLAGLHAMLDGYLDFALAHPELPTLWLHRWTGDAADVQDVESGLYGSLMTELIDMFRGAVREDYDLELGIWNIIWLVNAFLHRGITDTEGHRHTADHAPTLRRFRNFMHDVLERAA